MGRPPSAAAAAVMAAAPRNDTGAALARAEIVQQNLDVDVCAPKPPEEVSFLQGLRLVIRNRHFCVLVLAAGIIAGVAAAWQSLLQDILAPTGYSDTTIGYLGFINGVAGNIGSVLVGVVSDTLLRRRFKCMIMTCFGVLLLGVVWFALSVPMSAHGQSLLPQSVGSVGAALALAGLTQSATSPLLYELCAELTYPVPEGTSAGVLALLWNLFSLIVIFISPDISPGAISGIMAGTTLLVIAMVGSIKEVYRRPSSQT